MTFLLPLHGNIFLFRKILLWTSHNICETFVSLDKLQKQVSMNIKALKHEIIEWVTETEDTSLLKTLKSIKDSKPTAVDWYDELSDKEIASINRGVQDHKKGEVLTSREFWSGHGD